MTIVSASYSYNPSPYYFWKWHKGNVQSEKVIALIFKDTVSIQYQCVPILHVSKSWWREYYSSITKEYIYISRTQSYPHIFSQIKEISNPKILQIQFLNDT